MQAKIGKIKKRINSTSQTFSGTNHNVVLLDSVSVKNPRMLITGTPAIGSNFMHWNGAYYWIDDIVSETKGLSWINAHLDPLATYKDSITHTKALVRFGSASDKSFEMDDPRFYPDLNWTLMRKDINLDSGLDVYDGAGSAIITAVAANDIAHNGVNKYIISYTEAMQYFDAFGSTIKTDMDGASDVKEAIQNAIIGATGGGNWSDNIKSMIWVPFDPNTIATNVGATYITEMGIGGYRVSGPTLGWSQKPIGVKHFSGSLELDWPTLADTEKFLRGPKYCSMALVHPCGIVPIDTTTLIDQSTIYYSAAIDFLSGDYYVCIKESSSDSADVYAMAQGNTSVNVMGMIAGGGTVGGNILGSVASIAKEVAIPSFTASMSATTTAAQTDIESDGKNTKAATTHSFGSTGIVKNFMQCGTPPSSLSASVGHSPLCLYHSSSLKSQFYLTRAGKIPRILSRGIDADYISYCDDYGYPVNNWIDLSGVTGYVECADVSVKPTGSVVPNESELSALNSALCAGIYIED